MHVYTSICIQATRHIESNARYIEAVKEVLMAGHCDLQSAVTARF